jgi:hypothetical protein
MKAYTSALDEVEMKTGDHLKVYLGDSVYAEECDWQAGAVTLTTDNGYGPSNTIVLEPDTLRALDVFRDALRRKQALAKGER